MSADQTPEVAPAGPSRLRESDNTNVAPSICDVGSESRDTLSRLLYLLHGHGGVASRAQLTAELDCGRSAMGYLIRELRARDLVEIDEHPEPVTGGGRPSHRVAVAPSAPYVVAARLGAEGVDVAAVALGGVVLRSTRVPLRHGPAVDEVLDTISTEVRAAMAAQHAAGRYRCFGVGLAVPSPVRVTDGYVAAAMHLGWRGTPLRRLLAERLPGVQLALGNDANLAALAEYRHGAGRGARELLYVTTSRIGIGGGLVSSGRLFVGANGYALEAGHVTVDTRGVRCVCGSYGCLEVEADQRALLRAAGRDDSVGYTTLDERADEVLQAAAGGDPVSTRAVTRVAARLGTGLAALVNIVDPDTIVLGGMLGAAYRLSPEAVRDGMDARSYISKQQDRVLTAGTLSAPELLGAADLAFQPLLDNPRGLRASAPA